MQEYLVGALGLFVVLVGITGWRVWQYTVWYQRALQVHNPFSKSPIIFMPDHYPLSEEFKGRLRKTVSVYQILHNEGCSPSIVVTCGKLIGWPEPIADVDKMKLVGQGVPEANVHTSLGTRNRGAADTFEEVRLACDFVKKYDRFTRMHIVTNPLQGCQIFMIAVRQRVLPHLEVTPFLMERPFYVAGKLFQILLTFYSPRGKNPISLVQRYVRRHVSSKW